MSGLKYVGASASLDPDLAYQDYPTSIKTADLSTAAIDSTINSGLSGFTTVSYTDTRDALNATQAYVNAGDAARVHLSAKDIANGVAGLDSTGKINVNRFNVPSTQQFNRGPWTPSAYQSLQSLTAETTLFTCPITDPGYSYKLVCHAVLDAGSNLTGEWPSIVVRQGSTSGPIVAQGSGCAESYGVVQTKQFKVGGAYSYTVPSWATRVDVVLLGGGAGGQGGNPFTGQGGSGGAYTTKTLIKGTDITGSTISGTIGAGGTGGDASQSGSSGGGPGGATTAAATGMTALSAAGGTNSNPFFGGNAPGLSPGNRTLNSQTYVGGGGQPTTSSPGVSPGGGGAGGLSGATTGGAGAAGSAWFFAYGSPNPANAPVMVIPTSLDTLSVLTGATTLYVRGVRSGSSSTISVSAFKPSIHVMAIPA